MNPFGTLAAAGVPLAFGTDAPVTPLTGWGMVRDAVQHSRAPERMALADAFDAATRGAHWAAFADGAGLIARRLAGRPGDLGRRSRAGSDSERPGCRAGSR